LKLAPTAQAAIGSVGTAPLGQTPLEGGAANNEKPKVPRMPPKFRPGPRIPDPKDIY
jgi:hypothetical protein